LYEPTEGQILLDGIDASEYSLESWRRQFGVVFQDLKTFSMSVAENVLMRPLAEGDEERVIEALKQSGGWDKVQSLPNGIHTTLTREFDDKGVVLSGGESQKIALARIFADPSPIVILDEPSSALDPIAEYTMFNNMLRACEGRTLLFISHRLSSAVLADRVILLDGGRIVEMGPHEELMRANGHYAEMFRKQAENYVDTAEQKEVNV
jgi:ATP-binding cassette subfamily B protein